MQLEKTFCKFKTRINKVADIIFYKKYTYIHRLLVLIKIFDKVIYRQLWHKRTIPIIIINFNRLTDIERLVDFLLNRRHTNIIIIDNNSDYPPLLEYYDKIKERVDVQRMNKNWGHMVLWKNRKLYEKYCTGYYIVTDSDIIPNENLPANYLSTMIKYLNRNSNITKVGFALQIDDIPDTFKLKAQVLKCEEKYWKNEIKRNVFNAFIDTTFALYLPRYDYNENDFLNAIRLGGDFCSKHGGWYINHEDLTTEEEYYFKTSNESNSWKMNSIGNLILTRESESYM